MFVSLRSGMTTVPVFKGHVGGQISFQCETSVAGFFCTLHQQDSGRRVVDTLVTGG